jgi:hypothetical protein
MEKELVKLNPVNGSDPMFFRCEFEGSKLSGYGALVQLVVDLRNMCDVYDVNIAQIPRELPNAELSDFLINEN